MAKKGKATKKSAKRNARRTANAKSARGKGPRSKGRKAMAKARTRPTARRTSSRAVESSSGSTASSLDPRRVGNLRLNNEDEVSRRRRINDLQGISMRDRADSESVGELLDEGQTLEAEAVQGVEDAPDADQGDVRTREVPEDDVPQEYLDEDTADRDR